MTVTLRQLRAAVGVAQHGSFRRAADAVHLSQPALSLAISELEGALGVTLFDRTSRSVTTTELGAFFVQGATRILGDFDRLVQEVGGVAQSRRGRVVVSCVSSLAGRIMPLALQVCAEHHPQVDVIVHDDVAQQVLSAVRSRDADFGLTMAPAELGEGMLFEPLHEDRFHLVCVRDHRLATRRRVAWRDLDGENLISLSTSSGTHQMIQEQLARQSVKLARNTPVSHLSTVHGMLEAGFGVAILPVIALPIAGHPTLVARPLVGPNLSRTIGAYRRRDRSLSPAADALLEVVRTILRDFPGTPDREKKAGAATARKRASGNAV
jgi:DNA-binding transcriptional LysR family regulator